MKKILLPVFATLFLIAVHLSAQTADSTASFSIAGNTIFTGKYKYKDLPFDYMTISVQDGNLYYSVGKHSGTLTLLSDRLGKVKTMLITRNATIHLSNKIP